MGRLHLGWVLLCGISVGPAAAGQDAYYASASTAGKDLANQFDFLVRSLVTIPDQPKGRGLYKQTHRIMIDLIYFREQVQRKVSRDSLSLAFSKVDGELKQLLDDLQGFEKWDPAIRASARRTQSALHEVHIALAAEDSSPVRQGQSETRQIQVLLNRAADLQNLVSLVIDRPEAAKDWSAELSLLHKELVELQRLHQNQTGRDALKQQLLQAEQTWEKLVVRFKALPTEQTYALREDFGQVDHAFARLYQRFGLEKRRTTLRTNFLP